MTATFASTALTGPTLSEEIGKLEIPTDIGVLVTPLLRGVVPAIRSLGNQSHTVTIECVRRYSSILAAMQARATFIGSLATTGELVLVQVAGAQTLTITGEDAVRAACPAPELIGVSVRFRFVFQVPTLTASIT